VFLVGLILNIVVYIYDLAVDDSDDGHGGSLNEGVGDDDGDGDVDEDDKDDNNDNNGNDNNDNHYENDKNN